MAKIPPPWQRPDQSGAPPVAEPRRDGRFKPGQSGNPAGRPKGLIDRRQRLSKAMQDEAEDVVRVVIDAAKGGDLTAAGIVISRVVPALRPEGERVEFDFDAKGSQVEQVEQVLQAMSQGHVSVETAKQITEALAHLSGVRQIHELEARIKALEERRR